MQPQISHDFGQRCKVHSPSSHLSYFSELFILQVWTTHKFILTLLILLQMPVKLFFSNRIIDILYHSSDPPSLKKRSKFWLPSPEGGSEKLKNGVEVSYRGRSFEKRGWHFSYLIFSRFIIFTFRNHFTLCKFVLCIWRKIIFFCHHNFVKKDHAKLSKIEPENIP